jgi:cell division protein FtsQ
MARKNGLSPEDDALSPSRTIRADEDGAGFASRHALSPDDAGEDARGRPLDRGAILDLEPEEDSPFLRAQKRVPVRRGPLPSKKAANRLKYAAIAAAVVAITAIVAGGLLHYGRNSWRFRVESSDHIQIAGNHNVARRDVLQVFGGDIARNIFSIPLDERKKQVERIPWVESATVMRLLPNRLRVEIRERTPVAFVQIGARIALIDGGGVVMEVPAGAPGRHSFPVVVGMKESDPLSTRAARMRVFALLMRELEGGGANYSRDVAEVDVADPEDVRITVTDGTGEVLIHLGASNFLDRYKIYVAHVQEWRQQFQRLDSVDLRYDRQVIVNPDVVPAKATKGQRAIGPKS